MTSLQILLLVLSGFAAGAVNAFAGGGTFFTFAALVFAGLPTLDANATSAVALTPANLGGVAGYRDEVRRYARELLPIVVISLVGAAFGAWLLISIGDEGFRPTVPWLLLFATVLFALAPRINGIIAPLAKSGGVAWRIGAYLVITLVAIYSGFFGAGAGIMMLAALAIVEGGDFHKSNAIKNVVAFLAQIVSSVMLIAGGLVHWRAAVIVMMASVAGTYVGVLAARRAPLKVIRAVVVTAGAALSAVFFLRKRSRLRPLPQRIDAPRTPAGECQIQEYEAEQHGLIAAVQQRNKAAVRVAEKIGERHQAGEHEGGAARVQADQQQRSPGQLNACGEPVEAEARRVVQNCEHRKAKQLRQCELQQHQRAHDPQQAENARRPRRAKFVEAHMRSQDRTVSYFHSTLATS